MYHKELVEVARRVCAVVNSFEGQIKGRSLCGISHGGDPQYNIDQHAEQTAREAIKDLMPNVAIYTEDGAMVQSQGEIVAIVDPIDGTRSAAAGLEMATVSIALAKNQKDATLADIRAGLVMEIKTGAYVFATDKNEMVSEGFKMALPNLNTKASIDTLFWTIEFNGHPARLMTEYLGDLIDNSSSTGGIFVFNSSTYSILKIITGQLDAYVDIGNRLLKDNPSLESTFRKAGAGSVLHLFPYDLAAIHLIAKVAGVNITDAYGKSLDTTKLFDVSWKNQQSCIATSTAHLSRSIREMIGWGKTHNT